MSEGLREWTSENVPTGPYFHGTRAVLRPGDQLATDIVGYDDARQMCWATTSLDAALQWALQRGRHIGPILYVYEVALDDVLVDTNVHRVGTLEDLTSVMGPHGRVVALVGQMHESEHPNAPSFGIRPKGR